MVKQTQTICWLVGLVHKGLNQIFLHKSVSILNLTLILRYAKSLDDLKSHIEELKTGLGDEIPPPVENIINISHMRRTVDQKYTRWLWICSKRMLNVSFALTSYAINCRVALVKWSAFLVLVTHL